MTAVNFVNCPYCCTFNPNLTGMHDLWEEMTCRYCNNTFSTRIQVSKGYHFKLNEIAVKEKDEMITRIANEREGVPK